MNIDYCEVCGVVIQSGQGPVTLPEGVICASCFETRRVVDTQQTTGELIDGLVQFDCCYCHSLLRLKAVTKRTRVRCPKCSDAFYLHEDGRIEARLEGSKTAVLQQEDVAPLGRPERAGDKTQPIKRTDVVGTQHAMLEELKPKGLDFVEALPKRQGKVALDTSKYRRPSASDQPPPEADLRASEEGDVDLGASELRRKTQGMQAVAKVPSKGDTAKLPTSMRSMSKSCRSRPPMAPRYTSSKYAPTGFSLTSSKSLSPTPLRKKFIWLPSALGTV